MSKHDEAREFDLNASGENSNELVRQDDLVELVLGPLGDQIDGARLEILAAIRKVNESTEIIAREMARQAKRGQ
jgi:hypothetical protein